MPISVPKRGSSSTNCAKIRQSDSAMEPPAPAQQPRYPSAAPGPGGRGAPAQTREPCSPAPAPPHPSQQPVPVDTNRREREKRGWGPKGPELKSPCPLPPRPARPPPPSERSRACPSRLRSVRSGRTAERPLTMHILGRPYADISETYEMGERLGEGVSGETRVCRRLDSGAQYACKTILKRVITSEAEVEGLRTEIQVLELMAGLPQMVQFVEALEDSRAVHIVMEHCVGGDLFSRLEGLGRFSERSAASVLKTLAEALILFGEMGLVHRDLKLENILLLSRYTSCQVRIADFGVATFTKPGKRLTEVIGSPYYMAPELLLGKYGIEVDVWSAGAVLHMLLCGRPPFLRSTQEKTFRAILTEELAFDHTLWRSVSPDAKDLLQAMLQRDRRKRITPSEILEHPWIKKFTTPRAHSDERSLNPSKVAPQACPLLLTSPCHSRSTSRCSIDSDDAALGADFSFPTDHGMAAR